MSTKDIVLSAYFGLGVIGLVGFFVWHRKKGGLGVLGSFVGSAFGEKVVLILGLILWPLVIAVAAAVYAKKKTPR